MAELRCHPRSREVVHVDATRRFPFGDGVFDFVFSEHIPYQGGLTLLRESARVLKSGGRIRVATPDLAFLVDLCRPDRTEVQQRYLEWSTREFLRGVDVVKQSFVINNFVREWGHTFIYDRQTLQDSLERAGFVDVQGCELNSSVAPELKELENEERMPAGFLRLESMVLEATKGDLQLSDPKHLLVGPASWSTLDVDARRARPRGRE